jgi:hyperosmotically inducible periplasmic protein
MNDRTPLRLTLAIALAATALAACDRNPGRTTAAPQDGATVGQKLDNAMARTKEELARAGEQIKPSIDKAGEKISAATGSDAAITTSIKADYLKDPDLSVLKIDVDTRDGVVTLNGMAENAAARERAEKLAGAIKGVKQVHNHLSVKQG